MNYSISILKDHFKTLETSIESKLINVDNELAKATQREHNDFQLLNDRQTNTEHSLAERFKQLDSQNIKIEKVNEVINRYCEEISLVKLNFIHLDSIKANKDNFEQFRLEMYEKLRIIKVEHDQLQNKVISLENFADKYIPLVAQNITCDTLNQVIGHKERKKLELYEEKIYQNLHETILCDEGNPNIDKHRDELLKQINNKLTLLKQIMDERKFLVPKEIVKKRKDSYQEIDAFKPTRNSTSSNRLSPNYEIDKKYNELKPIIEPPTEEEIQVAARQKEAEEKIKKMQVAMGRMNLHRVDSQELAELASIESSNIDYAEVFEEKFKEVDVILERTNVRINKIIEIVEDNEKTLRNLNNKTIKETEQYVSMLHNEFDVLVSNNSNKSFVDNYTSGIEKLSK